MVKFGLSAPAVRYGFVLLKRSCCGIRSATTTRSYKALRADEGNRLWTLMTNDGSEVRNQCT